MAHKTDTVNASIPGLFLWEDFCTQDEATEIVDFLDACRPPWSYEQFGVKTSYRSKHFGALALLRPRSVRLPDASLGEVDLPTTGAFADLCSRLHDKKQPWHRCLGNFRPNEANVNDYQYEDKPQLHMHWDDRGAYDECICSISLLGAATMSFCKGGRSNLSTTVPSCEAQDQNRVRVHIPARSLLLLSGAARYEWQHGIPNPEDFSCERRVSIIFRRVRLPNRVLADATRDQGGSHCGLNGASPATCTCNSSASVNVDDENHYSTKSGDLGAALIISTNWPDPDASAAGHVTCARIACLKAHGVQVLFASSNRPGTAMNKLASSMGIECIRIVMNNHDSVNAALKRANPQLVLFDGFNAEERFSHYVHAAFPHAMRVLDMQDFHALRLGREQLVEAGAQPFQVAQYMPNAESDDLLRELAAVHRCDEVLAISEEEQLLLVNRYGIPLTKVHVAPLSYLSPFISSSQMQKFEHRQHVMFIGNWRHKPNRDCAQWLVREVWPHVHAILPEIELRIYGSSPTGEDMALTNKDIGVTVCGFCKSVSNTMQKHRLLVAPLRYGAGVKGKLADAMRYGLVTVTTPFGTEGLGGESHFPGVVAAVDAQEFASAVVQVYADEARWNAYQHQAANFVEQNFAFSSNSKHLWDILSSRWKTLSTKRLDDTMGQLLWHASTRYTEWKAKYLEVKQELSSVRGAPHTITKAKSQSELD